MIQILHVDDERMDFELARINIKKADKDFKFRWIDSASDALDLLEEEHFDCILCDFQMPGMDGLEFLHKLRQRSNDIPFIFLTGQGNETLAVETFRAGADDYYSKEEGFAHYDRLSNSIKKLVATRGQQLKLELAQKEAKIQNEKFSVIFGSIDDAIFVHPLQKSGFAKFIEVNDIACARYGYTKEEFLKLSARDITIEEDINKHEKEGNRKNLLEKKHLVFESVHVKKNGDKFPVEINSNIVIQSGKPVILAVVRDITERKNAENELIRSRSLLKTLMRSIPDMVWLKDPDGVYITCNPRFEKFFGHSEEEIAGKTDYDFVNKELADFFRRHDSMAIAAGVPSTNEEEVTYASDGHKELLETIKTPMFDEDGSLQGVLGVARDITGRKEIQRQLEEHTYWYEQLLENLNDMIVKVDLDGNLTYVSPSYCQTFGRSREQLLGKQFMPLVHEEDREATSKAMEDLYREPFRTYLEQRALTVQGWRWFAWMDTSIRDEKGNVTEIIGVGRDITSIKEAEEQIIASENRFRLFFEDFPVSLWEEDASELKQYLDGLKETGVSDFDSYFDNLSQDELMFYLNKIKAVNVNKASVRMYGAKDEKDLICNLGKTFREESFAGFREVLKELAAGKTSLVVDSVTQTMSGQEIFVHLELALAPGYEDSWGKLYISIYDISKQKKAEAALQESEARFRALSDASFEAIFLSEDGFCIGQNKTAERMFGFSGDEAIGRPCTDWIAPEERGKVTQHLLSVFENPYESIGIRGNNEKFPVEVQGRSIQFQGKNVLVTAIRDISEKKAVEEHLKFSEGRFREIIEDVSEIAIQGYDEERKVTFWNRASEKLYGYSEEEALGGKLEDLIIPEVMRDIVIEKHRNWLEKGEAIPAAELILRDKWGKKVPVFSSHVLHQTAERKEMFCVDVDLSPIKKVEDELRENWEKLEYSYQELEAFSRSVAHDLKAPLRHMSGFASILSQSYNDVLDKEGQNYLKMINDSAANMTALVDDILNLSMGTSGEMDIEEVNLAEIAKKSFHELFEGQEQEKIKFICPEKLITQGDSGLLSVVMTNLLGNSVKFTSKVEDPEIQFGSTVDGKREIFYIKDNGAGFNPDYARKLFVPFQRLHSKADFKGTGLGLATVRKIIERHGGKVWAEGEPGKGAVFYFTLKI